MLSCTGSSLTLWPLAMLFRFMWQKCRYTHAVYIHYGVCCPWLTWFGKLLLLMCNGQSLSHFSVKESAFITCLLLNKLLYVLNWLTEGIHIPNTIRCTCNMSFFWFQGANRYCPHHVGHYLGMDLHDTPLVSKDRKLEPGTVVTIEPGESRQSKGAFLVDMGKVFHLR